MSEITYIDSYIREKNSEVLSLKNFYNTLLVSDESKDRLFRIPFNDFFIKYREQLEPAIQFYTVSESMFYKPKSVSKELYGTTELWLSLLRVNGMTNITEFHLPIIKVYNPDKLREIINIFFKREKVIT